MTGRIEGTKPAGPKPAGPLLVLSPASRRGLEQTQRLAALVAEAAERALSPATRRALATLAAGKARISPLYVVISRFSSEKARLEALRELAEWLGPPSPDRRRLLLGELRRLGIPRTDRDRALHPRIVSAVLAAVEALVDPEDESEDGLSFALSAETRRRLRTKRDDELSADLLGPDWRARLLVRHTALNERAEFEAFRSAARELAVRESGPDMKGRRAALRLALRKLTPREREVAELMMKGRTDTQISRKLKIAESTVRGLRYRFTKRLARSDT